MTELFIDGYPVSLPDSFEIDYYVYNPFFSRKGEYTYDIDIDLRDKQNEKVYSHINRLHVNKKLTERRAILISDSKVIVAGTEIILSLDDDKVKIQIVAGNSELNYLSGGSSKIKEMNLGQIDSLDYSKAMNSLTSYYPDFDYVCTPVYKKMGIDDNDSEILNLLKIGVRNVKELAYEQGATLCPQPYLVAYIRRLCEALGYSVADNVLLEDERFSKMIIVHGYITTIYSEMIPEYTVNDFLTEIEKFCNVIFVVNQMTKKIRIMGIQNFYENADSIYVAGENVIDKIEKKYDVKDGLYFSYDNIRYDLPNNSYYDYACIEDELMERCEVIHAPTFSKLQFLINENDKYSWRDNYLVNKYNKLVIYIADNLKLSFVLSRQSDSGGYYYYLKPINCFKNIVNEDSENAAEFKVIPAEIAIRQWSYTDESKIERWLSAPIPVAKNISSASAGGVNEFSGMNEYIESGIPNDNSDGKIHLCVYDGVRVMMDFFMGSQSYVKYTYPFSYCYPYYCFYNTKWKDTVWNNNMSKVLKYGRDEMTMSLLGEKGLYETIYSKNKKFKLDIEHVILFQSNKLLNALSIYIVDNKKFYCMNLHYKIRNEGISKEVEGTFYPM